MSFGTLGTPKERPDVRLVLLRAAQDHEQCAFQQVKNIYTDRIEYYRTMATNIRKEFLDCVESGIETGGILLSGRGQQVCGRGGDCTCTFTAKIKESGLVDVAQLSQQEKAARAEEQKAALEALKDNLVSVTYCYTDPGKRDSLFWITGCDVEVDSHQVQVSPQVLLRGFGALGCGCLGHQGQMTLKVVLFAGDFASRYRATLDLLGSPATCPELELAVMNPKKLVPGTYSSATRKSKSAKLRRDVLPINPDQQQAVVALQNRVEIIHGPPGTGKSTTIFHALSVHLPPGAASVVTCVCNQAVDAVAEKLRDLQDSKTGGLPMLVLGNPKRVGLTAKRFTLDALADTEELVVFMRKVCKLLQRFMQGLRDIQAARATRLLAGDPARPVSTRLSFQGLSDIRGLRSRTLQRLLEANDAESAISLGMNLNENQLEMKWKLLVGKKPQLAKVQIEAEMVKTHLDVLHRARRAMANAAVRLMPIDSHGKSVACGRASGRVKWKIGEHIEHLNKQLSNAHRWLNYAVERAPFRVVRRTRVFLCTIPSSYRIEQLKDDYPEDFPARLFMAMCDEAAATAETYVPLMMKVAVQNLVLLGDHKQLQPLVLATDHLEPERKKVSRSLMERMLDAGYSAHLLRTQYRMFDRLCLIVSGLFYESKLMTAAEKLAQEAEAAGAAFRRGAPVRFCWDDWEWYEGVIRRQRPQGDFVVEWEGELVTCPVEWIRSQQQSGRLIQAGERLRWFDLAGHQTQETKVGTSYVNAAEAAVISHLLRTDPVLKSTAEVIKIIVLYKPQVTLLEKVCADVLAMRPNIQIVTVDACQGTEAPHILLSTVRSTRGRIGFASNPRRLNVAISRAQESLTLVGSSNALTADHNWAKTFQGFKQYDAVQKLSLKQLHAFPCGVWKQALAETQRLIDQKPEKAASQRDWFGHAHQPGLSFYVNSSSQSTNPGRASKGQGKGSKGIGRQLGSRPGHGKGHTKGHNKGSGKGRSKGYGKGDGKGYGKWD